MLSQLEEQQSILDGSIYGPRMEMSCSLFFNLLALDATSRIFPDWTGIK